MDTLIQNRILFQRIHEFNVQIRRYVHQSRLEEYLPRNINLKWDCCGRADDRISLMLRKQIGNVYDYDFREPSKRILLLYYDEIVRLAEYTGLAFTAELLRHSIQKKQHERFRQEFDEEKLRFVYERASLLTERPLSGYRVQNIFEQPAKKIRELGFKCIQEQIGGYEEAVLQRFRYKFPQKTEFNFIPSTDPVTIASSWCLLAKILKTEMNTVWKTIFA